MLSKRRAWVDGNSAGSRPVEGRANSKVNRVHPSDEACPKDMI